MHAAGRTLLLSAVFPPQVGGSGRYLWEVYRRLPPDDFVVAAGTHRGQAEFDQAAALEVVRLPLEPDDPGFFSRRGLRDYSRSVAALRRLARAHRIGRVHCARCVPEGWMAWLLKRWCGLPYLCFAHGEEVKLADSGPGAGVMSSRQVRWMAGQALRGADLLVANSHNTRRILLEEWGLPPDRIALLHPGVDVHRYVPAPQAPEVRARLGWGRRPVLLTVARLQQRKGHDRMIRALHRVRRAAPDVLYAIVGDGPERASLEALVVAEGLGGHVQFLGEVDDETVIHCYQQCDLFVHPNRQVGPDIEGFGLVLLEAQACGKPVVAGASGGTAETMRIPETGRVVPCDDPRELAELVAELLADAGLLARMGAAARLWAEAQFDWDAVAARAGRIFGVEPRPVAGPVVGPGA
ncbi:MAG TPA: glycosyltransferase family 4 protein [Isosphaeraceae bacterium]|jgi:phosphatidylinositol alpha-1,6-mannosyltransferase